MHEDDPCVVDQSGEDPEDQPTAGRRCRRSKCRNGYSRRERERPLTLFVIAFERIVLRRSAGLQRCVEDLKPLLEPFPKAKDNVGHDRGVAIDPVNAPVAPVNPFNLIVSQSDDFARRNGLEGVMYFWRIMLQ
jgi:hypothetical protein